MPDDTAVGIDNVLKNFESSKVHIKGLVVQQYSQDHSHYMAIQSLGDWLKKNDIPAIYGVDTRLLTKKV